MKRDGVGWDDHPVAGFESALLRIALAIEMQRYLWMTAEGGENTSTTEWAQNPRARVRMKGLLGSGISVLRELLAILKDLVAHGPIVFLW